MNAASIDTSPTTYGPDLVKRADEIKAAVRARIAELEDELIQLREAIGVPEPVAKRRHVDPARGTHGLRYGSILLRVYDFVASHPGWTSLEMRPRLKLDAAQLATCLHTLSNRRRLLRTEGARGNFRYFAVDHASR